MRKSMLCLIPLAMWMAWAQAPQGAPAGAPPKAEKKDTFKNKAPVSKEVLRVKLPKAVEMHLDNGLTVLILEDHRVPQIQMSLEMRGAGGFDEPADKTGLAAVTATMMREGTSTHNTKQIAEEVDRMAATLGASSSSSSLATTVTMSGLTDNFDQWFALGTELLMQPTFPAEEWAKLKQRQLIGLRQQRTSPVFLANERFSKAVYGSHRASVVSPTEASLNAITPDDMKKWHDERWVPQNAILGIVGDITPAQIMPKLKEAFAGWKKTGFKAPDPAKPAAVAEAHVWIVNRPGSVQTNLLMGNIAIDRRSPDYLAVNVMNRVLGASSASRLFNNLREDKGYTYGAYSNFTAGEFPGPWSANSEVRTDVTEGSMKEFFNEFRRMRDERVPEAELEERKRAAVAAFALSLESPAQLLSYSLSRKGFGLPEDYWDTYPAQLSAVTADDVQRVAKKYLSLDNIQIVAVGDATKIKPILEKYGKVTVYDTNGNIVE